MPRFQIFYDEISIIIDAENVEAALSEFEDLVIYESMGDVVELTEES